MIQIMMTHASGDWTYLGTYLRREIYRLGYTPREFAEQRVGISYNSLSALLAGRPRQRWPRYLAQLEHALGWAPGDCERVLGHQDPLRDWPIDTAPEEVERWIWNHHALPVRHRRALVLAYRAILAGDHNHQDDQTRPDLSAS